MPRTIRRSVRKTILRTREKLYDALARSESQLRATLYSIGDAVIATDAKGRVAMMNPVAEQLTGWREDEARGKPLAEVFRIVNEETRAPVEDPVTRVLRDGTVIGLGNHTLLLTRDGREISIADAGAPIHDAHGKIVGVVLVFRDQTTERTAQRAVQEAREYAENIVATARDPLIVLDANLRVISANRAFYRVFATTPAETEGRLLYELGNRQWDIPELRRLLEDILPHNTAFDDYHVTHDFECIGTRTMLLNARRIHREGKPDLILLAIEDITERQRAEDKIHYQANLIENVSDAIISTDLNFIILTWNRAAETIYGWRADQVIGKAVRDVLKTDYPYDDREQVLQQFRANGFWKGEVIQYRKDGTPLNILAAVSLVYDLSLIHIS
ncbi:MAG: PAS domain S-box protein, partial [Anaerolineae bacterium]|nr:PAS domain S-box protein [Anaerolineae bacterium]